MTTEEKLQHFYDLSIESAQEDGNKLIESHQTALNKTFAEHQEMKRRQAEAELKAESDMIKRNFNKEISAKQLQIKRQFSAISEELSARLFAEVEEKLAAFKETPSYLTMLCGQIKKALEFADGDEMTVYIDPSDAHLKDQITASLGISGFAPTISHEPFKGGTRAVIRSKNILIDNSFLTLIKDEKEKFTLEV